MGKSELTYTDSSYWKVHHVLVIREIRRQIICYTIGTLLQNTREWKLANKQTRFNN